MIFYQKSGSRYKLLDLELKKNGLEVFFHLLKVFEANIRLLGGLLSAHLLMEDVNFPGLSPDWYLGRSFSNNSVPDPDPQHPEGLDANPYPYLFSSRMTFFPQVF